MSPFLFFVCFVLQGITLIGELIDAYDLDVVLAYMKYIQQNAEVAVRDMLREIGQQTLDRTGSTKLSAVDYMDDGTPIALNINININEVRKAAILDNFLFANITLYCLHISCFKALVMTV